MASAHVGREVERAASKRKQLIAFRVDAAPLTPEFEYFLSSCQWIEVPTLGMPAALKKLSEAVGQGRPGSASAPSAVFTPTASVPRRKSGRVALAGAGLVIVGVSVAMGVHFWSTSHRPSSAMEGAWYGSTRCTASW